MTAPGIRERLHDLVDEIPDERLDDALHLLVLMNAPEDDEPLTDEEIASIQEGQIAFIRGESIPHEEAMRRAGLREPSAR